MCKRKFFVFVLLVAIGMSTNIVHAMERARSGSEGSLALSSDPGENSSSEGDLISEEGLSIEDFELQVEIDHFVLLVARQEQKEDWDGFDCIYNEIFLSCSFPKRIQLNQLNTEQLKVMLEHTLLRCVYSLPGLEIEQEEHSLDDLRGKLASYEEGLKV